VPQRYRHCAVTAADPKGRLRYFGMRALVEPAPAILSREYRGASIRGGIVRNDVLISFEALGGNP